MMLSFLFISHFYLLILRSWKLEASSFDDRKHHYNATVCKLDTANQGSLLVQGLCGIFYHCLQCCYIA